MQEDTNDKRLRAAVAQLDAKGDEPMTLDQLRLYVDVIFAGAPDVCVPLVGSSETITLREVQEDIARAIAALDTPAPAPDVAGLVEAAKLAEADLTAAMKPDASVVQILGLAAEACLRLRAALAAMEDGK